MQKSMRLTALSIVAAAAMAPAAGWAQDSSLPGSFSGNVSLANDYVFRGFSQTLEEPTIQGGLDWDSGAGFYIGTWASNVKFGDGDEANMEWDVYAGYAGEAGGFSYDVGVTAYFYPGASSALDYDMWEAKVALGYDFEVFSVGGSVNYSPDFFGGIDDGWYFDASIAVPLAEGFSVDAKIGYQDLKPAGASYTDWNIGMSYEFEWFTTDLRYYDTDVAGPLSDGRFVISVSRSF